MKIISFFLLICNFAFCDYELAKQEALAQEKPLLIVFLGPNWCPHSDQLEEEILADLPFIQNLKKDVVLYKVEIPEEFEEESYLGQDLKEKFHVEECPSLVLAEPSGEEIAKLTFLPVGQKEFASVIKNTLADYKKVSRITKTQLEKLQVEELKSLYAKAGHLADEAFKKAFLNQGLKTDRSPYFLLEEYSNLLTAGKMGKWKLQAIKRKIQKRDPKNADGYMRELAVMDFESLASVKKSKNAEVVVAPLVKYLKNFGSSDTKGAWEIEMKISQYYFSQNKIKEALAHAKASFDIAPEEHKGDLAQSIQYLEIESCSNNKSR
ncbi:MAG: thioredoxin family protein [Simkaniaceae bacterium]|nr:thioredoxin family protein [Candidatus Sacchlamyda saccharinae]